MKINKHTLSCRIIFLPEVHWWVRQEGPGEPTKPTVQQMPDDYQITTVLTVKRWGSPPRNSQTQLYWSADWVHGTDMGLSEVLSGIMIQTGHLQWCFTTVAVMPWQFHCLIWGCNAIDCDQGVTGGLSRFGGLLWGHMYWCRVMGLMYWWVPAAGKVKLVIGIECLWLVGWVVVNSDGGGAVLAERSLRVSY